MLCGTRLPGKRTIVRTLLLVALLTLLPLVYPNPVRADCSLVSTGNVPLPDLAALYHGAEGGLYPPATNQRPVAHEATGLMLATEQVVPRDGEGNPDPVAGKIVMLAVGMSNTQQEFGRFAEKANRNPAKNPKLVLVNGAMSNMTAARWAPRDSAIWEYTNERLARNNVTPAQVQVAWIKQVNPGRGPFPEFAEELQGDLEAIVRNLKHYYPNLQIAYLSSRTRAYVSRGLSSEPVAYESGFAVKWLIEKQIRGDATLGLDEAPWLSWGPYLWTDGLDARSDGFVWMCDDTTEDFVHPSTKGQEKVADQLLAFFKTDPTAQPWFLKAATGAPVIQRAYATPQEGDVGAMVLLRVDATDPDGIAETIWTYGDGAFSYNPSGNPSYYSNPHPAKRFFLPGVYPVRLTVVDSKGNWSTEVVPVTIGGDAPPLTTVTPIASPNPAPTPTSTPMADPPLRYRIHIPTVGRH
jgi:hypothetical protein